MVIIAAEMDTGRRFLSSADLAVDEGAADDAVNPLEQAFVGVFRDVLRPIFDEVYPEMRTEEITIDNIRDEAENVIMFGMGCGINIYVGRNKYTSLGSYIEEFATKKDEIKNGARWAVQPTVKGELLESHGLSEEQFLIKVLSINVWPHAIVTYQDSESWYDRENYGGVFQFAVVVEFRVTIEDISTIEPEGIETQLARYRNLCSSSSRYNDNELRTWAKSLGFENTDTMSKDALCEVVGGYYGF